MNHTKIIGLLLIGVFFCASLSSPATVQAAADNRYVIAGIEDAAKFESAFLALQAAVAANDRNKVADSILYPLRVNGWIDGISGKTTAQFTSRKEVMEDYDEIFTPQVKEAFAKQKVADLFVNWQGVMVGKGEAWLAASEKTPVRYGISTVNLEK